MDREDWQLVFEGSSAAFLLLIFLLVWLRGR